jgi:hypothetical protein
MIDHMLASGVLHYLAGVETPSKMVQVIVGTGSCPMETDLNREMSLIQLTSPTCCQRDHPREQDKSESTTVMVTLLASSSTIRRGHYSGRLDILSHGIRVRS